MSYKLTPVNKTLIIDRQVEPPQKPDQFGFVLPEKVNISKHILVTLKSASEGSAYERYVGHKLVVVNSMIEVIEIKGKIYSIISENGVVAVAAENELF